MRVLVTGATGYIGKSIVPFLEIAGHLVFSCDVGWFGESAGGDYAEIDTDEFDLIIHLAAHSSVNLCEFDPEGAWENNVGNFRKLVSKLLPDQKLVYASSGSVYGNLPKPASENDASLTPIMTYDMTKIVKDVIAQHAINHGKQIIGLRFGTVNGLSPNTRIDLMLNAMVHSATANNVISVKNPKISRPILFLPDLHRGILQVMKKFKPGVYNLASLNVTVEEVAGIVRKVTGAPIEYLADDLKPYNFHLDTSKFESTFGDYRVSTTKGILDELVNGISKVAISRRDSLETQHLLSLRK